MRKLLVLPLVALLSACADTSPVELPITPDLDAVAAPATAAATSYAFQVWRDWACGEADGCSFGTSHTTPSDVIHGQGLVLHVSLVGGIVGEAWVTVAYNINFVNGKGVANGTVEFDLAEPGVGTFTCAAHAEFEDYAPPDWAYVEHAVYSGCTGTGDFEGKRLKVWLDNEANPGSWDFSLPDYEGQAVMW